MAGPAVFNHEVEQASEFTARRPGRCDHGLAEDRRATTGGLKASQASADYIRPTWAGIGAMVIGRQLFDMTNGWEGLPPAGEHVVVVSHRPKPAGWHPDASYHFVDDVGSPVATAKQLAGERTVALAAGDVGGQALALGLVDEVAMDVVPVVFGSGKRYFGAVDSGVVCYCKSSSPAG